MIDKEFFLIKPEEVPDFDGLRDDLEVLRKSVLSRRKPTDDEGHIQATISKSQLKTLEVIARNIWDMHQKFNAYERSHFVTGCPR